MRKCVVVCVELTVIILVTFTMLSNPPLWTKAGPANAASVTIQAQNH